MKNIFFASMIVLLSACNTPISAAISEKERQQTDARKGFVWQYYSRCDTNEEKQTLISKADLKALGLDDQKVFEGYLAKLRQNLTNISVFIYEAYPRNSLYEQRPINPIWNDYVRQKMGYENSVKAFSALFKHAFGQPCTQNSSVQK